jgi:hypothetical protein
LQRFYITPISEKIGIGLTRHFRAQNKRLLSRDDFGKLLIINCLPQAKEFLVGFKFGAGTLQKVALHFFPRQRLRALPWKKLMKPLDCLADDR